MRKTNIEPKIYMKLKIEINASACQCWYTDWFNTVSD